MDDLDFGVTLDPPIDLSLPLDLPTTVPYRPPILGLNPSIQQPPCDLIPALCAESPPADHNQYPLHSFPDLPVDPSASVLDSTTNPGYYNFRVTVAKAMNIKNRQFKVAPDGSVYARPKYPVPFQFMANSLPPGCWVRAIVMYASEQHVRQQGRISKCATHMNRDMSASDRFLVCHKIESVDYQMHAGHHCVMVPFNKLINGVCLCSFTCYTSCMEFKNGSKLIKPWLQLHFTLLSPIGEELGRHVMRLRVCACPTRDAIAMSSSSGAATSSASGSSPCSSVGSSKKAGGSAKAKAGCSSSKIGQGSQTATKAAAAHLLKSAKGISKRKHRCANLKKIVEFVQKQSRLDEHDVVDVKNRTYKFVCTVRDESHYQLLCTMRSCFYNQGST